jgi:tRNA A37 threonylcarbamoyltransferase TsaD
MTPENSMTDNVLQTLQHLIQDVIAPDVRELKVRLASYEKLVDERFSSLGKEMDTRFDVLEERIGSMAKSGDERFNSQTKETDMRFSGLDARINSLARSMDERFDSQARQSEMQFNALMAAISESKAQADLARIREVADLRERIAVIESKLGAKAS